MGTSICVTAEGGGLLSDSETTELRAKGSADGADAVAAVVPELGADDESSSSLSSPPP